MLRNKSVKGACTDSPYSFRPFIPVNMAGEEVAELVVGNDSGMCKAGFLGDDAARAEPSDGRHDGRYGPAGRKISGITHSATNSGLRLKNIQFC